MRVLLVLEASSAGVGRHVVDLARGLLAEPSVEVHLVYSPRRIDDAFASGLRELPSLKTAQIDMRRGPHPSDWRALRALRRYLREHGPFDVCHAQSSKGGALARMLPRRQSGPVVYTPHCIFTMNPTISKPAFWTFRGVERWLGRRTETLIAVSPDEGDHLVEIGIPERKVCVIPNGVDAWVTKSRDETRAELGLPLDRTVIGFVGRMSEQKNPELMVEAFAQMASRDAVLAMVGDGPLRGVAEQRATELGVDSRIHWLGYREARDVLHAFDLFALSSRYEGLPYVLLEALISALPIVSTSVGGTSLAIDPGVNGFVSTGMDAAEFAQLCDQVVADPKRLAAMGQASKARAAEFSIAAMVRRTLDVYEALQRDRKSSTGQQPKRVVQPQRV